MSEIITVPDHGKGNDWTISRYIDKFERYFTVASRVKDHSESCIAFLI